VLRRLLLAFLVVACDAQSSSPDPDPDRKPSVPQARPAFTQLAARAGGFVSSVDDEGMPSFIWAIGQKAALPTSSAREAAAFHLERFAPALDLRAADLETAELRFLRNLGAGGWIAEWKQRVKGIEVYPSEVTLLMKKNMDLVAISGRLRRVTPAKEQFELTPEAALALALDVSLGVAVSPADFVETDETHYRGPAPLTEARVKPIFHAKRKRLVPAYFVEFYAGDVALRVILSASDGHVIDWRDLTANDAFAYRVWADPITGRPFDGPFTDVTPHRVGMPDGSMPSMIAPSLVMIDGFNSQRDPWLQANATETRGNNVDAYSDHDQPDGFSNADFRATTTGPNAFDRIFDPTMDPIGSEDQIMASVTELFYVNNWLHDWWYDSGFDEAAGNAQLDNYGRGGEGGDPLHAEAQDNVLRGNRNNANMSTPADGLSPRMQMYSWTGRETVRLTLNPGGEILAGAAAFGPRDFDVAGEIVDVEPARGCTAITNNVAGRVALVDRGACPFTMKTLNAQAAGAIAVLVVDNAPGSPPPTLGGADPSITIPAFRVTLDDGTALRTALAAGVVSANLYRVVEADRDGSLDHTVVSHEWGHYLHHRLADCGNPQCSAMSEGWGDWNSIFVQVAAGDDHSGAYPTGVWATLTGQDASYFGIRRVAYSTDFDRNALTFRHISDAEALPTRAPISPGGPNSEVHNAGEVWATMLHEAYVALIRAHTSSTSSSTDDFASVQRLMGDYIVAGLQLTPRDATYTEARDAILAAAYARSSDDLFVFADAFARRGAGSCAVPPSRASSDFVGVVEGYDLGARISIASVDFDENLRSCDQDGVLDADERGAVRIVVGNAGPSSLSGASITLSSTSAGVLFPAGATMQLAEMAPFSSQQIELSVALDPSLAGMSSLVLSVRLDGPGSCQTTTTSTVIDRVNYDEVGGASSDDVESSGSPWVASGPNSEDVWARMQVSAFDHAWVGADFGEPSDTVLESPTLEVTTSTTDDFVFSFEHRFEFEADATTFWDGGVIEISGDDGATWEDLSSYLATGYVGALTDTSGNPLALRMAYSGTSTAWPDRHRMTFNLGNAFAARQVRIRFRIGTDAAVGRYGWEIDNLRFQGIMNAPFEQLAEDVAQCPPALIADAGEDRTAAPGEIVILSGSGISFENLPFSHAWSQVAGPIVPITNADTANPIFVAPIMEEETRLTFELAIDDGVVVATDTVDVVVAPTSPAVVIADAGTDQTVEPNGSVVLDGSRSTTTGTLPLTFAWAQTAGTPVTVLDSMRAVVRFAAPAPDVNETLTFTLTISDGLHTDTDSVDITVLGSVLSANAGPDQIVDSGTAVIVDGSASRSTFNDPLVFAWEQMAGPTVTLDVADAAILRFTAPEVTADTALTFRLTVEDGVRTAIDLVDITVRKPSPIIEPEPDPDPKVEDEGCGCTSIQSGEPSSIAWLLLAVALLFSRRISDRSRR
jgi:large repetitive protein